MIKALIGKLNPFVPALAALLLGILVFIWLNTLLPGFNAVEIELELDHADRVKLFTSTNGRFSETGATKAQPAGPGRHKLRFDCGGRGYPNHLRIDLGESPGVAIIHRLALASYFVPEQAFNAEEIARRFKPGSACVSLQPGDRGLRIVSECPDPNIVSSSRLLGRRSGLSFSVALAAGLMFFVLADAMRRPESDTASAASGPREHLPALDGLRGVAAMMVVADHTWGWFRGTGASGVWIFFALSGFLLALPFARHSAHAVSLDYLRGYCERRFRRILPVYACYIAIVYGLREQYDTVLLHLLFLQGDGHLWALPQEVLFYLVLPAIAIALHLLKRMGPGVAVLLLIALLAASNALLDTRLIGLLGQTHIRLRFFAGIFLSGVLFAYLQAWQRQLRPGGGLGNDSLARMLSPLGMLILLFLMLLSNGSLFGTRIVYSQWYFGTYGLLAGLLVFCSANADGLLRRVLCWKPLRVLGIVGLSLYLAHPLVLQLLRGFVQHYFSIKLKGAMLFLPTLAVSALISVFSYSFIEAPSSKRQLRSALPLLFARAGDSPPIPPAAPNEALRQP